MRRLAAWLADTGPVVALAGIAGAGSFDHIRETAIEHGQRGPMSWAIAVCIDLTCVMAARERQRDRRTGRQTQWVSWPVVVLALGVLLSVAANLEQAQPTTWGRITAATPAAAFLIAISMLERRKERPSAVPAAVPVPDDHAHPVRVPPGAVLAVPAGIGRTAGPGGQPDPVLISFARQVAAEHRSAHGTPITRDALRARLGVSNQLASQLLHDIRTQPVTPEVRNA